MAAIMPRLPDASQHVFQHNQAQPIRNSTFYNQPQSHYNNYNNNNSHQVSPPSMLEHSPTSPAGFPSRRRANAPLFVPAVLRPNLFPSREPYATPDVADAREEPRTSALTSNPNSGFINLAGIGAISIGRFARRSSSDSANLIQSDLDKTLFPPVTAPPKRDHWKADETAEVCDHPTCTKRFGYFTRRHHCRSCGNIYCDPHSSYLIPLDEDAQYNPRGQLSRACNICFDQFRVWSSRTSSKASSDTSSTRPSTRATSHSTAPTSPVSTSHALPVGMNPHNSPSQLLQPSSEVAQSVPRDWNWSTF